MVDVQRELADLSDEAWRRIRSRLEGLTDEEYFWEPAPGCWSIRQRADGSWYADWPLPRPDPEPFTTIAWRLWHLIDMYGEDRAPKWLDVPPQGAPIGFDGNVNEPPATAADAVAMLERAHERWDAHLALADDERLTKVVGPVAGPQYAGRSRAAYVLHMLDEFIHHGAEIALLRDLWRWQHPIAPDAVTELVMRGDASVLDAFDTRAPTADLVGTAATYGRWPLVLGFVERGAPVTTTGTTPLHHAAGAGELEVVQALLDHGADPTARDPEFHATPQQWAEFLHRADVAAYLRRR
jgi:uncharacterized damage-inducible protein DinB